MPIGEPVVLPQTRVEITAEDALQSLRQFLGPSAMKLSIPAEVYMEVQKVAHGLEMLSDSYQ